MRATLLAAGLLLALAALPPAAPSQLPECADGIDNDGDGATDFPSDTYCASPLGREEYYGWLCTNFPRHQYGPAHGAYAHSATLDAGVVGGAVTVWDSSLTRDCNGDGMPGEFDGDYDVGTGGAFFGYGPWRDETTCHYGLVAHGGYVRVEDLFFGSSILFFTASNDYYGPTVLPMHDPVTGRPVCETDGIVSPQTQAGDCLSDADGNIANGHTPFVGEGEVCGQGGGDGGFWVVLVGVAATEEDAALDFPLVATFGTVEAGYW